MLLAGDFVVASQVGEIAAADFDCNGIVDFSDFLLLSENFEQEVVATTNGDVNGNGAVDFADFLSLSVNWGRSYTLPTSAAETGPQNVSEAPPRVVGAASTDNNSVVVHFSESMGDGALNPKNYFVIQENVNPEAGVLLITSAEFAVPDRSAVKLTTMSQNELTYRVRVSGVRDIGGDDLASRITNSGVLVDPTSASFRGTAPTDVSILDTDGDGLTDNEEQRGWTVSIVLLDGRIEQRGVTSDPLVADTDNDGFTDAEEAALRLDPRDKDTDDDLLEDPFEFNIVFSDPARQDTDGDNLHDGDEYLSIGTSALLADTDGDQFSDDLEYMTDNRNPRIADLPVVRIDTGNINLALDVRFEQQDSEGASTIDTKTVNTTLVREQEDATSRATSSSSSKTSEWFVKAGAENCVLGACEQDTAAFGFKFSVEGGYSASQTSTYTTESAQQSQRAFSNSLSTDKTKEQEVTTESVINRLVEGASFGVEVNISNGGNLAFSIQDIEITALTQDPNNSTEFIPVATLRAVEDKAVTIGPLSPDRGPFRFQAVEAFPSVVESLMENPRGLIFRVANFEIQDESGRNFSFVEQDINDRTAFLEIDYAGNQELEQHRVATNAEFNAQGRPTGLTMQSVMEEILGLTYLSEAEDAALEARVKANRVNGELIAEADDALLANSYSTREICFAEGAPKACVEGEEGVDALWRIKDVSRELTGQERDWWVLTPQGMITPVLGSPGRDFNSATVFSEQDFAFKFVQDLDSDGLEASQEAFYRTIDGKQPCDAEGTSEDCVPDSRDTDNDGIDDGDEIYGPFVANGRREPWKISLQDGRDAYTTFAHPKRPDTDGDGLDDCQELGLCPITIYNGTDGVPSLEDTGNGVLTTIDRINPYEKQIDENDVDLKLNVVVDNQGPGFSSDGDWETQPGGFGGDVHLGLTTVEFLPFGVPLITPGVATFQFTDIPDGKYQVWATWPTEVGEVADSTRFVISTEGQQTQVRDIVQSVAPNDEQVGDIAWEKLVVMDIRNGTLEVAVGTSITAEERELPVVADAIRIERLTYFAARPTDPAKQDTDEDGLSDAAEIAGFAYQALDEETRVVTPSTNPATPFATNPLHRDTDFDGLDDAREAGLGTNPLDEDDDLVRDDDGDGLVNAVEDNLGAIDGVRWPRTEPYTQIVDNADAGVSFAPGFETQPGGFRGEVAVGLTPGFGSPPVANYEFSNVPNGRYRISATWPAGLITVGPTTFRLMSGSTDIPVNVFQINSPSGDTLDGVPWQEIREVSVNNGQLSVLMFGVTPGLSAVADAIRIDRIDETITTQKDKSDTDGDGLTDWEEFWGCRDANRDLECDDDHRFGQTNPTISDTDGDGLTDLQEVDGVEFVFDTDNPIRVTNPLGRDSDRDGRSDFDEIDSGWDVEVVGKPKYHVYSDPNLADADGDGLLDGAESTNGSDPYEFDTDKDGRSDAIESRDDTLTPNHVVSVTYASLAVFDPVPLGIADFHLDLRRPAADGGLGQSETVYGFNDLHAQSVLAEVGLGPCQDTQGALDSVSVTCFGDNFGEIRGLRLAESLSLPDATTGPFSVPFDSIFVIEGYLDIDRGGVIGKWNFGGFTEPDRGIFVGSELDKGVRTFVFETSIDQARVIVGGFLIVE